MNILKYFIKLSLIKKIIIAFIVIGILITAIIVPVMLIKGSKQSLPNKDSITETQTTNKTITIPNTTVPLGGECDKWTSTRRGITETINPHTQILNGKTIIEWCYINESTTLPEYPNKEIIFQIDKLQTIPNYYILDYNKMNKEKYPAISAKVKRMIVDDKYTGNSISRLIRDPNNVDEPIVDRIYNYTC